MILTLTSIELYKIFKKWRTYIGFIAIAVLVSIVQIALWVEGESSLDLMTRDLKESFVFVGNLLNGYLVSYIILNSITIHIPFLIALVAGDLLAGESTAGTYRMLLTRPVSRMQILVSKFLAGVIYSNLIVLFLALMSLGVGIITFGVGELIVVKTSNIVIFAREDILWRFLSAYGFAAIAMMVVASLAFLFSSLVENSIGPIISTMAVIIVFVIISAINIDFFKSVSPYLFTTYFFKWQLMFDDPVSLNELYEAVGVLLVHIAALFLATSIIFKRKDILS